MVSLKGSLRVSLGVYGFRARTIGVGGSGLDGGFGGMSYE